MYEDKFKEMKRATQNRDFLNPSSRDKRSKSNQQPNRFITNQVNHKEDKSNKKVNQKNKPHTELKKSDGQKIQTFHRFNKYKNETLEVLDGESSQSGDEEVVDKTIKITKGVISTTVKSSNSYANHKQRSSEVLKADRGDIKNQATDWSGHSKAKTPSAQSTSNDNFQGKQQFETTRNHTNSRNVQPTTSQQQKNIQKSYHSKNKNNKMNFNNEMKDSKSKSKVVNKAKEIGSRMFSAATSKGVVITSLIIGALALVIYLIVMLVMMASSSLDTKYLFTEAQATEIEQLYTKKELEYLKDILDEADDYTGDFNVNIDYDPVGHDPHEILSLFNVMLRFELSQKDTDKYSFNKKQINKIIDNLMAARYEFTSETEDVVRNIRVENEDGSTSVEQITTTITNLRSRTNSINNIIAGASYDTPKNTSEFIAAISDDVQEVAYQNDLYASVIMAQAILETGSGKSGLSKPPYFNLFGIKGSYNGESVTMYTKEDDGLGNLYTISSRFRDYPSYKESIQDYATVMKDQPSKGFYSKTYKSNTNSYRDATAFLTGTYATDTQYGSKLNSIIQQNNLTKYDTAPTSTTESNSNDFSSEEKIERVLNGDVFALTEYERDLFQRTFDVKGLMGIYPSPVDGVEVEKLRTDEPFGLAWNATNQSIYSTKGLLMKVDSGLNVISQITGKVSEIKTVDGKATVTIQSENTLAIDYGLLENINVSVGSHVRRGKVIGKTSNKGLRLAARDTEGEAINPLIYMNYERPKLFMYSASVSTVNTNRDSVSNNRLNANMAGQSYDDADVQRLFDVGRKYIGYPYVFGGSSPGTSFDCSGFIYWVFKEAGLKNWTRTTANEIYYSHSAPISEAEARPGDLVFFEGTYNAGVPITHVGIYAGDGVMLHAGDPIGFTSFKTAYWQKHNPTFGRLTQN